MSMNELLYEYYASRITLLLTILILLPLLTFAAGWFCGERWNIPNVTIEVVP